MAHKLQKSSSTSTKQVQQKNSFQKKESYGLDEAELDVDYILSYFSSKPVAPIRTPHPSCIANLGFDLAIEAAKRKKAAQRKQISFPTASAAPASPAAPVVPAAPATSTTPTISAAPAVLAALAASAAPANSATPTISAAPAILAALAASATPAIHTASATSAASTISATPAVLAALAASAAPTASTTPTAPGGLCDPFTSEELLTCGSCGKTLSEKSALIRHKQVHDEGSKKYVCGVCGKRQRQRSNWKHHVMTHIGENIPPEIYATLDDDYRALLAGDESHVPRNIYEKRMEVARKKRIKFKIP
ncbi:hypothetical protein TCAL_13591 [Tigriopus californicus]|uniref:C2H2-type domain-containing protein n=1 Tax=Tigriopus californicus TaxID=6832 RepID=A0A553PSQ1_TIGCA|nr:zinc finger protein 865-like [Tigriopus californicus]TRY80695.1 hypothetical protein TCAL_13591 [Tigriopus californicus]|eukprot:TCALIF_13591-PA protein Name:"Similar to mynn Myoneurin (Xenopus laevis)" AED:0.22 eAED:0.08 QI:0/1/0/1/1/1/3/0/305